ncbi:unnamed protein product [Rotaria magnacalcarata]|uniref:HAT C-terminal dimerisation domain-containing protein n=3 Tax=Rotaria magnacalcarata TaxID=392030 RepID=A0A816Z1T2_9BILA|nr:unnamed protein product [Rotaria magnacalcarata]
MNETSDTNLRSHLGKMHQMIEFLYPSQKNQIQPKSKLISIDEKKKLDEAAIEAIVQDSLPFNHFQKSGMKIFLSVIKYGYQGPNRKTVRKRLGILYQQHRAFIKKQLSSVLHISLTTDVWKSPNNEFFICLTCHFLTSSYVNESFILSFRRFDDKHTGQKFRSFIDNELRKMNLKLKVSSITTDGGSDIKSATLGTTFGMRLSCAAHNLNLVVKNALWLFNKTKSKKFKSSSNTTDSKQTDSDDDDDDEAISVDDNEEVHEDVSDDDYDSDISDQHDFSKDDSTSDILSDENASDISDNDEVEDDDEDLSPLNGSKQRQNDEQTPIGITAKPSDLSLIVYNLLQRVRRLVRFIRKSSVLYRYIRNQIRLKNIEIVRSAHEQNLKPVKLNNAVLDFRIRWNTTYTMISRFIALSSIITDITVLPSIEIGLKKKQYEKLQQLSFSRFDWSILAALKNVLFPFYRATTLLSGSKYPTLSIAYSVSTGLKNFLTKSKDDQPLENSLKQLLLAKFSYYFEQEISWDQKRATLIAAFLDPTSYQYLTDEDIGESERTLLSEFDVTQSFDRLQIDTSVTTTMSMSTSTPLGHQRTQNSTTPQEKLTLDEFFRMCEMPSASNVTTNSIKKQLSFKEELCHYMSTAGSSSKFSEYWCQHEMLLPQLSQFVKKYNCIPATSVPSESAFSIAGYLQRKARSSLSSTALRYSMVLRE